MSGDPAPPRMLPPCCCPFHASGGHWDSGHSQERVRGFYGDADPGTPSAGHLGLIRRLRDVGTGAVYHEHQGLCPYPGEGTSMRDRECKACDILREADALLGDKVSP